MRKKVILICSILILVLFIVWFFIFKNNYNKKIDNEDYLKNNTKILTQLQDDDFWNEKINKYKDTLWERYKIFWYGLLCEQYEEDLSKCSYRIWAMDNSNHYWRITQEIAMNDIWNWWVFYDVSYPYLEEQLKLKYLWENFKLSYEGDYGFITVVNLLTNNNDWSSIYHIYIISWEWWEILYKKSEKVISRETAKQLIANDIWINKNNVKFLYFRPEKLIYKCNFSYNWHTYEYEINAKNWIIIKGVDEIDIGDDEARKIAMNDAWITWNDLTYWDWHMWWLDEPTINKLWSGESAMYTVEFRTNKDINYFYKVRAFNWEILYKTISE